MMKKKETPLLRSCLFYRMVFISHPLKTAMISNLFIPKLHSLLKTIVYEICGNALTGNEVKP